MTPACLDVSSEHGATPAERIRQFVWLTGLEGPLPELGLPDVREAVPVLIRPSGPATDLALSMLTVPSFAR